MALYTYKNRKTPRLWTPKRDVINEIDRLSDVRLRLVNAVKMLEKPLTDSKDFVGKKAYKGKFNDC